MAKAAVALVSISWLSLSSPLVGEQVSSAPAPISRVEAHEGPTTPTPIPVVRVFRLKFRRAEEASLLVRPLLTETGSVVLQSKLNTLTVRDDLQAIQRIAQAVASYDVPPRAIALSISLLKASSATPVPGAPRRTAADEIRGVGESLRRLFKFTDYTSLDSVVVQGTEGDSVTYAIGGVYRLEFLLDPSGDEALVRMKNVALSRLRKTPSGQEEWRDIVRTSLNVPIGQPYVLGVGKDETAVGALFLVIYATVPGPGIAGVKR